MPFSLGIVPHNFEPLGSDLIKLFEAHTHKKISEYLLWVSHSKTYLISQQELIKSNLQNPRPAMPLPALPRPPCKLCITSLGCAFLTSVCDSKNIDHYQ